MAKPDNNVRYVVEFDGKQGNTYHWIVYKSFGWALRFAREKWYYSQFSTAFGMVRWRIVKEVWNDKHSWWLSRTVIAQSHHDRL